MRRRLAVLPGLAWLIAYVAEQSHEVEAVSRAMMLVGVWGRAMAQWLSEDEPAQPLAVVMAETAVDLEEVERRAQRWADHAHAADEQIADLEKLVHDQYRLLREQAGAADQVDDDLFIREPLVHLARDLGVGRVGMTVAELVAAIRDAVHVPSRVGFRAAAWRALNDLPRQLQGRGQALAAAEVRERLVAFEVATQADEDLGREPAFERAIRERAPEPASAGAVAVIPDLVPEPADSNRPTEPPPPTCGDCAEFVEDGEKEFGRCRVKFLEPGVNLPRQRDLPVARAGALGDVCRQFVTNETCGQCVNFDALEGGRWGRCVRHDAEDTRRASNVLRARALDCRYGFALCADFEKTPHRARGQGRRNAEIKLPVATVGEHVRRAKRSVASTTSESVAVGSPAMCGACVHWVPGDVRQGGYCSRLSVNRAPDTLVCTASANGGPCGDFDAGDDLRASAPISAPAMVERTCSDCQYWRCGLQWHTVQNMSAADGWCAHPSRRNAASKGGDWCESWQTAREPGGSVIFQSRPNEPTCGTCDYWDVSPDCESWGLCTKRQADRHRDCRVSVAAHGAPNGPACPHYWQSDTTGASQASSTGTVGREAKTSRVSSATSSGTDCGSTEVRMNVSAEHHSGMCENRGNVAKVGLDTDCHKTPENIAESECLREVVCSESADGARGADSATGSNVDTCPKKGGES